MAGDLDSQNDRLRNVVDHCGHLNGAQKTAFVGSHNCTQFALEGLNREAGVLIEGAADNPVMRAIESHVKDIGE